MSKKNALLEPSWEKYALRRMRLGRTYTAPESEGNAVVEEGRLGMTGGMECSVSQTAAL